MFPHFSALTWRILAFNALALLILTGGVIGDLLTNLPSAKVEDDHITFERRSIERKANEIIVTSRRLVAAARAITGRRTSTEPEERTSLPPDPYAPPETKMGMPLPEPPAPMPERTTDPASTLDTTSYEMSTPSSLDPATSELTPD